MDNKYNTNDELEQYLRDEVEDHKMYPSEHVWENIRTEIHGNPSWPALSFIAIAVILALTISTVFNYPPKAIITKTNSASQRFYTNDQPTNEESAAAYPTESLEAHINPNNYTTETIAAINEKNMSDDPELVITQKPNTPATAIVEQSRLPIPYSTTAIVSISKTGLSNEELYPFDNLSANEEEIKSENNSTVTKKSKYQNLGLNNSVSGSDENASADSYLSDFGFEKKKALKKATGFEFQFYITPSTSYRKLIDDQQRLNFAPTSLAIGQSSQANINNSVRHTPALGMEIGAGIAYNLTSNFKIKTGLQYNIRQYYIDATQNFGFATFAFVQNNHLDSVSIFSMFGNNTGNNGYYSTKIDNKLYQVSIPIGFQWDFLQGKKLGLSASASIQPTLTLNKNVYMISTDYKYYANGAPFIRTWNFNSSVDLNITYKTGTVKWYVGPQIRYQHLPTYNDVYPIKEYRLDYGIKLGITTPIFKYTHNISL
jgi:hypothetical protein